MKYIALLIGMLLLIGMAAALDTNTSLYLPFNGTSGTTTTADYSSNALNITNGNTASISSTQYKFYNSSYFGGNDTSYWSVADNSVLHLNGGVNYTIGFWVYTPLSALAQVVDQRDDAGTGNGYSIVITTSGEIDFNGKGLSGGYLPTSTGAISANTWTYIQVNGNTTHTQIFVNGVQKASTNSVLSAYYASPLKIGTGYSTSPSHPYSGYVDDLFILKGEMLSGSYVPTTEFFNYATKPTSAFTSNVTSGNSPLAVSFTDTTSGAPTAWNWSFKDVTGNNTEIWFSTSQNPTKTFNAGNFSIVLNASNSYGFNTSPSGYFINVTTVPGGGNLSLPITSRLVYSGTAENIGPSSIQITNGSYLTAWTHATALDSSNDGVIYQSLSGDYGNTWSAPITIASNASYTCEQGYYFKANTTHLYIFYAVVNEASGQNPSDIYYKYSTDNGTTWGSPVLVAQGAHLWPSNSPIRLSNQRIVIPAQWYNSTSSRWEYRTYISDDNLSTISLGGTAVDPSNGYVEGAVVQLPDTTLYATLRHYSAGLNQYHTTSTNNGTTWNTPSVSNILSDDSPADIVSTQWNTQMFIWDNLSSSSQIRTPLYVGMSQNNMSSITSYTILNSTGSNKYSYPGGSFSNSTGYIGIPYTDQTNHNIYFASVNPRLFFANLTDNSSPQAIADFSTLTTDLTGNAHQFNDTSLNSPTSWLWNFGDGDTSTLQNPVHTYVNAGAYTISLSASNLYGATKITRGEYVTITAVNYPPVSNFTSNVSAGVIPLNIQFNDTSLNSPTSWLWNFGDGDTSTLQNPVHTYSTAGNYSVVLNASNSAGYNTTTKYINAYNSTLASFTSNVTSGTKPLAVAFTDTSTNTTPTPTYYWSFGDGNTSTSQNPAFTYTTAGTYTVNHSAGNGYSTSWSNQTNYITVSSIINPNPTSMIGYKNTISTTQINNQTPYTGTVRIFNVSSNTTWVTINGTWDNTYFAVSDLRLNTSGISGMTLVSSSVHNGWFTANVSKASGMTLNPASILDFNITMTKYAAPGTSALFSFTSSGSAYYDPGNSTQWSFNTIRNASAIAGVWEPITANFTGSPTLTSVGTAVAFTDASTGYPDAWSWDFGDGYSSTSQNPSHAYSTIGLYSVSETAYLSENATVTNTSTRTNYINVTSASIPVAAFTGSPTNVTLGSAVTFTDQSTGTPSSWLWTFGDGSTSTLQNPVYTYAALGTYNVSLKVSNFLGNNTLTKTGYITVSPLIAPIASFTSNTSSGYTPLGVQFNDTSSNLPASWLWTFGDGGTSTSQNPTHTFTSAGNWSVNLTATNGAGSNTTTHYIVATTATGQVNHDMLITPEYTLVLTITDTSGNVIPVVTVTDSAGNNITTTNGIFTESYPYSVVAVYLSASGYAPTSMTYVMYKDRAETIQMTAATSTSYTSNVVYYPTQIEFILYTASGSPLSNALISATPLNFTAPANWTQTLLGINSAVNITGTTVSGYTGTDGTWAAPMLASNQYQVDISGTYNGAAYSYSITLYPAVSPVQLTIPIGIVAIPTSAANVITYSLTNTSINSTAQYVTMTYSDTSLSTSTLIFWVKNATGYSMYSITYTGSSANSQTFNQTFAVQGGQSYTYGIAADTSNFEDPWINQSQSFNINNTISLLGQSPGTVELWLAIAILVMWAAIGSIYFKHVVLLGEPILYWFIAQYFGWLPLTLQVYIILGIMLTLGGLIYIRYKENQII